MDKLVKFFDWLKTLPLWLRAIVLLLIASLILIFSTSCGQTVRVTVKDTPNGVTVSTTQNRKDSTGTNVNVNPTIHYNK